MTSSSRSDVSLLPPFRFSTVEFDLFRGGYPTLRNFRFLRRLQLKTIISMVPETPSEDLTTFCQVENIQQHFFQVPKFTSDAVTVSKAVAVDILELLLNASIYPVYLHCLDGTNNTGILFLLLRKIQHWSPSISRLEFCRFTRDHALDKEEAEFVDTFTEEIYIPENVPHWVWRGQVPIPHPTIPMKYHKTQEVLEMEIVATTTVLVPPRQLFIHPDEESSPSSRLLQALDIAGFPDQIFEDKS